FREGLDGKIEVGREIRTAGVRWVVPPAGIEPARLSALDFESSASTNSATEAASAGAHLSTSDVKMTSGYAWCPVFRRMISHDEEQEDPRNHPRQSARSHEERNPPLDGAGGVPGLGRARGGRTVLVRLRSRRDF